MSEFQSDPHWALFDKEVARMRQALSEAVMTKVELAAVKEILAIKDTEMARLRKVLEDLLGRDGIACTNITTDEEEIHFCGKCEWCLARAVLDAL